MYWNFAIIIEWSIHFAGSDYINRPYSVTFTSGVTKIPFKVSIPDDDIFEGNEYFILAIDSSSLPSGIIAADPSEAVVVILDGDDG